jgi:acyl-CoA thioesterase-1
MTLLKTLLIVLSVLIGSGCAAAPTTSTVLVMGDSLGAGYGVTPERAWVHLMALDLKARYGRAVVNASVSGETSGGGRARLAALLQAHHPEFVLLELGGNDGLRGQNVQTTASNLQDMVDMSQAAGAEVVLIGMQISGNYGPRYAKQFAAIYPALARRGRLALVPFLLDGVALNPDLMQEDRIHANDKGQGRLLRNVMDIFQPLLAKGRKARPPAAR